MLIFPCLIACACFSSDYFLSCLGDETRLSARNIDEVNTKFDEMFERIKLLEDKNVQLVRIGLKYWREDMLMVGKLHIRHPTKKPENSGELQKLEV